jgi:glycosyltransferase involved in cell wall biosynthesis
MLRSYNMLVELSREYQVTLIAPIRRDVLAGMYKDIGAGIDESREELGKICDKLITVEAGIGDSKRRKYSVALTSLLRGSPYSVDWFASRKLKDRVAAEIDENKYDAVHLDTVSMLQYVPRDSAHKLVVNHHNIESDMVAVRASRAGSRVAKWYLEKEAGFLRDYERNECRRAILHLTCSPEDTNRLLAIDSDLRAVEIPNGVDTGFFKPQDAPAKKDSMIFVGGLSWYPNRDAMEYFAMEVWPILVTRRPTATFDLIGKHPSRSLRALAKEDSRFVVHGFVDDIRPMVSAADVYVCPIRDGGGTKLKILDAMAMGKAIVAHPHAVDGINLQDGVDVLLATTPEEFCEQIERVFDNTDLRERLGAAARSLAIREYSYDSIGRQLRDLYRCL